MSECVCVKDYFKGNILIYTECFLQLYFLKALQYCERFTYEGYKSNTAVIKKERGKKGKKIGKGNASKLLQLDIRLTDK